MSSICSLEPWRAEHHRLHFTSCMNGLREDYQTAADLARLEDTRDNLQARRDALVATDPRRARVEAALQQVLDQIDGHDTVLEGLSDFVRGTTFLAPPDPWGPVTTAMQELNRVELASFHARFMEYVRTVNLPQHVVSEGGGGEAVSDITTESDARQQVENQYK